MLSFKLLSAVLIILLCLMISLPSGVVAQAKVGGSSANFLHLSNSARAVGMGGCAVLLVDEQAPLFNPGSLGLFYLDKKYGVSFPNSTNLKADFLQDARLKSFSTGIRLTSSKINSSVRLCFAASYSQQIYRGYIIRVDYTNPVGIDSGDVEYLAFQDEVRMITASFGLEASFFRLGIGLTGKYIEEELENEPADGTAFDIGCNLEVSVPQFMDMVSGRRIGDFYRNNFILSLTAVRSHMGASMEFINEKFPLPTTTILGSSLYYTYSRGGKTVFSARSSGELMRYSSEWSHRAGVEAGVLDVAFLRLGKAEGVDDMSWGFGVSLVESLRRLNVLKCPNNSKSDFWSELAENLDINFDYANSDDNGWYDTKYWQIRLSL